MTTDLNDYDGPVALLCGECSPYVPYFDSSKPTA